jgi:metal-responsive CopG/Arc/MetJ family transcriptional regulator
MSQPKVKSTEKLVTHVPASVIATVDDMARKRLQSRAQYVREAILEKLAKDGPCPA